MAFSPFVPDDFSTPGKGVELLPCPSKLPHDLEPGQLLARRFGPPYNTWYMGKIDEVNRRRTKSENVSVAFNDTTHGETRGMFIADAESYGAEKLWVLLLTRTEMTRMQSDLLPVSVGVRTRVCKAVQG